MYRYTKALAALAQRLRGARLERFARRLHIDLAASCGTGPLASYRLDEVTYPAETWVEMRVAEPNRALTFELAEHLRSLDMIEPQQMRKIGSVVAEWAAAIDSGFTEYTTLVPDQPSMLESEVHVVLFSHGEHGESAAVIIDDNETDLSESCYVYYSACRRGSWSRFNDADLTCYHGHAWAYRNGQVVFGGPNFAIHCASAEEIWGPGGMYVTGTDRQKYVPCPMCAEPCAATLPLVAL